MSKVRTVIVELEHPMDDDSLRDYSDEYYGIGRELVHCKDCNHSATGNYFKGIMCGKYRDERGMLFISVEENDYCSRAERKADNG